MYIYVHYVQYLNIEGNAAFHKQFIFKIIKNGHIQTL